MKLKIDKESDTLYFRLDESQIVESEEVEKNVILNFNKDGKVVGIEMLNLSKVVSAQQLNNLQFETS
ncbi:MAG: DUF2283 domain-containing protein [Bacteroidetes bacterium]|nr:MAG: DUF2283 domain-containing protein [Bacteroidota bacterium]